MDTVAQSEFFAKPEVAKALAEVRRVIRGVLPQGSFGDREDVLLALTDEAMRSLIEEDLRAIAVGFGSRLLVDGVEYKQHEPGTGKYHCLGGLVEIERYTYRPVGVHNGKTIVPLELAAGLAEGATPALAYNIAHGYGQHDTRRHCESLEAARRTPPPRATLERMAKGLACEAQREVARIENICRQTEVVPEGTRAVSIGLDRTAVPMVEERTEGAPPKPQRPRRKRRIRRAPKPFDIVWRMAYVGTVSFVDENGEAIVTRRYAAPACDDPAVILKRMSADVAAAVRRQPTLNVGIVQDGAPEMWNATRQALAPLQTKGVISGWKEGIDRFHLMEHLGAALEIVEGDAEARRAELKLWNDLLDADDDAIEQIETELTWRCVEQPDATQDAMLVHLGYLENNKDRMRYASLKNAGLPIGSGVTESAAKTVIGQRAKNSGQRWSEPGLRGVLTLRAIHQSDRLPQFWSYLSRRYTAEIAEAA